MSRELATNRVPGGAPVTASLEWISDVKSLPLPEDDDNDSTCRNCLNLAILLVRLAESEAVTLAPGEIPTFGAHASEADTWVLWTLAAQGDDGAFKWAPADVPDLTDETNRLEAAMAIALKITEGAAP